MLLTIDTSTRYAGVLLWDQGTPLASQSWRSGRNHTVELTPAIQHVLKVAGVTLQELEGIAVALGPGGFSALRVGLSAAKGFALALDLPLFGVTTLEAEAFPYGSLLRPVCPLLGVGRGEVAWAVFETLTDGWQMVKQPEIISPEELPGLAPPNAVFCGEGMAEDRESLPDMLAEGQVAAAYAGPSLRLWALAALGAERLATGDADDAATLQPFYLRRPSISTPNPPRKVKI